MKPAVLSDPNTKYRCAYCGLSVRADDFTTCDECWATFCIHCAHTITSEDVVCPPCYHEAMMASDEEEESA